jgi:hypothetical protein
MADRPRRLWVAALALACVAASCQPASPGASPQSATPAPSAQVAEASVDPNSGCDPAADPFADPTPPGREVPARGPLRPGAEREIEPFMKAITDDATFQRSVGFRLYSVRGGEANGIVNVEGAACRQDLVAVALQARYGPDRTSLTLYPLPGAEPEQPRSGNGWRLLAELPMVGTQPAVQVAADERTYGALMARLGIAKPPKVGMDRAIVVALMTSGGPAAGTPDEGPCDWVHFDAVTFDVVGRRVIAKVLHPRPPGVGCDSMFVPFTYVVAIDRAELPPRPFTVGMVDGGCDVCANEVVVAPR